MSPTGVEAFDPSDPSPLVGDSTRQLPPLSTDENGIVYRASDILVGVFLPYDTQMSPVSLRTVMVWPYRVEGRVAELGVHAIGTVVMLVNHTSERPVVPAVCACVYVWVYIYDYVCVYI
jgi:hypothetical protein